VNQETNHSFFDAMKDKGIIVGTVVLSKCGHDTGRIYIVVSEADSYLRLCDGDKRSLAAPKKKRRRHVCPLGQIEQAREWLTSLGGLSAQQQNSELRKGIRSFLDRHGEICDIKKKETNNA